MALRPYETASLCAAVVASALVLGALSGCAEKEPESVCGAGICPNGTVCDPSSGQCELQAPPASVSGAMGRWLSAETDSSGRLLVAAFDQDFGALVVSSWALDGSVDHLRVDGGPGQDAVVGAYTSLALGPDGEPSVAYYDETHRRLKLASRHAGAWSVEVADPGAGDVDVGKWVSLAVDGAGGKHLAYRQDTTRRLRLLSLGPGGCRPQNAEDGPHVEITADMMATKGTASSDFGKYASIGITGDGALVTSFYDATRGNLVLAICKGSAVDLQVLDGENVETGQDTGDVGLWSSLAIDAEGAASVAYFDRSRGQLKLARSSQGEITIEVVDRGVREDGTTAHLVGQRARLGLHGKLARIAYVDATARSVRLVRRSSFGTWAGETVVASGGTIPGLSGVGLGLDLAVDEDDRVSVAYGSWQVDGSGTMLLSVETSSHGAEAK